MSLILSAFHDGMCAITGDSIVRINGEVSEEESQKVFQLSNRVLYGAVGIGQGHDLILDALNKQVNEHHDLEAVVRILKKVCDELRNEELFKLIIDKHELGAYIIGFNKNRKAERYTMAAFDGNITFNRHRKPSYGALLPPGIEGGANPQVFTQQGSSIAESLLSAHSKFAYALPQYVSQDCTLYVIQRDGKKFNFIEKVFDTEILFKNYPAKEAILETLILK